ncbi:hypothetical protein U1Q18_040674 [Sarracenia purpurea var. burkii]
MIVGKSVSAGRPGPAMGPTVVGTLGVGSLDRVIRPNPRERESYGEKKLQEILDPVLKATKTAGEEDDSGVFGAGCKGRRD